MKRLDLQQVSTAEGIPEMACFQVWVDAALADHEKNAEVVVRIVDAEESQRLNALYRHIDKPTNVLSFPFEAPEQVTLDLLGDLVICAPVVIAEAIQQGKKPLNHWAHIIVHGILHLLGYDHINPTDAEVMEAKEIAILTSLNIDNPYLLQEKHHA